MKAAVIYQKGELPQYVDFPEPVAQNDNEVLVSVKAVAIKHFDKGRATGTHYSSDVPKEGGRVIGGDGVCLLKDGTRVYGMGVSGMLAETATLAAKDRIQSMIDANKGKDYSGETPGTFNVPEPATSGKGTGIPENNTQPNSNSGTTVPYAPSSGQGGNTFNGNGPTLAPQNDTKSAKSTTPSTKTGTAKSSSSKPSSPSTNIPSYDSKKESFI